ncbi:nucleoside hydrolase-like domain-containing protein [Paenibacillus silviterrae]|uniref:nucleoside hydrolase-like domain-containing protein n=1 Tax=Paenibacillus silviterrae TaxID=3242194 RepID=UPI002542B7A0|nr:nucleoside hydrolase-like domain-containing protein [Paenibacillus chinjuensis]
MSQWNKGALLGDRYRVIVSTDIGGSDPDDFQSMVHYLLYSDLFDTEGLISSPWAQGRKEHILEVIDQYEKDFENLKSHSEHYPDPDYLRSVTKQGTVDFAPYKGYDKPTEGSDWIIQCAKKQDDRPLYILIWGLLEDLAQALHDDPSIEEKLRVYYIGGPNKKWGLNAYEYIRTHFPNLWIIENNSTYRGWFVGGNQDGDLGNESFVAQHISQHGAMGDYFANVLSGKIKMGDTPSVTYLLKGDPEHPEHPSWGGSFTRVKNRPLFVFDRNTTKEDIIEVFGILELVFRGPVLDSPSDVCVFTLVVEGQNFEGFYLGNGEYRVRFMPKATGHWSYETKSDIAELNGQTGEFTCIEESAARLGYDAAYPNWWSDVLDTELQEDSHKGAKTVSMWRETFLRDFQARMDRCLPKGERTLS